MGKFVVFEFFLMKISKELSLKMKIQQEIQRGKYHPKLTIMRTGRVSACKKKVLKEKLTPKKIVRMGN